MAVGFQSDDMFLIPCTCSSCGTAIDDELKYFITWRGIIETLQCSSCYVATKWYRSEVRCVTIRFERKEEAIFYPVGIITRLPIFRATTQFPEDEKTVIEVNPYQEMFS